MSPLSCLKIHQSLRSKIHKSPSSPKKNPELKNPTNHWVCVEIPPIPILKIYTIENSTLNKPYTKAPSCFCVKFVVQCDLVVFL